MHQHQQQRDQWDGGIRQGAGGGRPVSQKRIHSVQQAGGLHAAGKCGSGDRQHPGLSGRGLPGRCSGLLSWIRAHLHRGHSAGKRGSPADDGGGQGPDGAGTYVESDRDHPAAVQTQRGLHRPGEGAGELREAVGTAVGDRQAAPHHRDGRPHRAGH